MFLVYGGGADDTVVIKNLKFPILSYIWKSHKHICSKAYAVLYIYVYMYCTKLVSEV